ncbi:MAG: uridine kinase [Gaiellaceae bacterium]
MNRDALVAEIAQEITGRSARRVGIDGVDGAGKTVFADELAAAIGDPARRLSVDDFLHPPEVRYRPGRDSPEGFFLDSYDYGAFTRALEPGYGTILVVDGIFLHRDELVGRWDYSIWLEVPFEISVARGARRGYGFASPDPWAESNRRYVEGQRLYLGRCVPQARATVVIDNSDLDAPRRVRG